MALTAGGLPYVESTDLVSGYPAVSLALAEELDDQLALKAALAGATYTGAHNFTGATVTGVAAGALSLVTPTSIANSGGSSSLSGGKVTFTTVNSISLNGIFTSTYDNYRILVTQNGSTGAEIRIRMRAAGTDLTSGSYYYDANEAGPTSAAAFFAASYCAGASSYCDLDYGVRSPFLSQRTRFDGFGHRDDGNVNARTAWVDNTTSYDGITIYPQSGTITGIARVYGYQNS